MLYVLLDLFRSKLDAWGVYSIFSVFDQLQFRALAAAGLAFALVLIFGKPTILWLVKRKIGDSGLSDAQALQFSAAGKANTPTMGGVLIVGAIIASTLLLADIRQFYVQLGLIVVLWLAVLGGFDDWLKLTAKARGTGRQGLYAWEKMAFQLGIGLLAGWFIYRQGLADNQAAESINHVLNLPFQKTYTGADKALNPAVIVLSKGAFIVLATLVIAGMSNAVNITDGMDGLAGGITVAICTGLLVLTLVAGHQPIAQYLLVPYIAGSDELAVLIGATGGSCLGFLWWNTAPAKVFMGDTGALALGGVLGYVAIVIRQEFTMLLMSGVFLAEMASVVLQVGFFKASGGRRIFRCAPYHHHLHLLGWPETQVVGRLWIVSVLLVVLSLALIKVR
jgi:phospho-N-acetylmuramoyl-pentapeptide-transferase